MKKQFLLFAGLALALGFILSCEKKNNSDAIAPDYGATGNPYPNNQTVTGSTTFTNPAIDNSYLSVGGTGWSNPTCFTTSSLSLRANNGNTDVIMSFTVAPSAGTHTYAVSPNAAANVCQVTITNAPDQPAGTVWVGKAGTAVVNVGLSSINATFTSITCTQANFSFPAVYLTGTLSCSQ